MPSFVLSLALLLLVLLTLLALSNRELVALTFLGFSTVALPLSVWIFGAIATGFLLGLWILLLFRFGTAGVTLGSGRGVPFRDQRRANYGPEDFAVVDERFVGEGDREAEDGYGDRRYDDARDDNSRYSDRRYDDVRYDDSRYSDNRYDDIYAPEQDNRSAEYGPAGYGPAEYDRPSYRDRAEPQDAFSANSGYDMEREATGYEATGLTRDAATEQSQADLQATRPATSAADPATPADWDDPYREDWTEAELIAEPVLRNETAKPKLKRWFNSRSQPQTDNSQPQPRPLDPAAGATSFEQSQGERADWQPAERDRSPSGNGGTVYDADYRVVQQPPAGTSPSPHPASQQSDSSPESGTQERPRDGRDRANSEWDIESDLDW